MGQVHTFWKEISRNGKKKMASLGGFMNTENEFNREIRDKEFSFRDVKIIKRGYPQIDVKNKAGNMEVEKGVRFGDVFLQVIFREMLVKAELGMVVPENRR